MLTDAEAIDLLEGLVRVKSLSTQEEQAVAWLVERMAALGMRAERDAAGNAVGVLGDGPRQVVLLGHIDTVPGDVPVRREGGRLYGRGSVDAKGPLAAFVCAAARAAIPAGWQVVVVGAVEEEAASSKGARYAATRYTPDLCVIGEPSGWDRITLGYKGRLLCQLRLEQPMAHTAGQAAAAAEIAVDFWNAVRDRCAAYNQAQGERVFDQITPSLRHIRSDTDGLRESVELTVGLRLPPGLDPHTVEGWLREIDLTPRPSHGPAPGRMSSLRGKGESSPPLLRGELEGGPPEVALTFHGHEAAYRADKNTALGRAFVRAIRAEGGTPAFKVKTGTADMNVVGPVWNVPIVAYGPGDSALDHTPDEHVDLDEYLAAVRVLTHVLSALDPTK